MVLPAITAIGAAAVPAVLNYFGSSSANSQNKKLAREQMSFQQASNREQMAFQKQSNLEQMQFQERMSNTAYQRAMQDMKQAGLNPILAYNLGGSSSPSGSSSGGASSSGASAQMMNTMAGAVSSAIDAKRAFAEISNLQEQNKNLKAQNKQIISQAELNQELKKQAHENARLISASAVQAASKIPGAKVEEAIDKSAPGMMLRFFQRLNPLKGLFTK